MGKEGVEGEGGREGCRKGVEEEEEEGERK